MATPHSRIDILSTFKDLTPAPTYLEVLGQSCLLRVDDAAVSATAGKRFPSTPIDDFGLGGRFFSYQCGGAEMMEMLSLIKAKIDIISLAGSHIFEETLREVFSSLELLSDIGIVVVTNVLPDSYEAALTDYEQVIILRELARERNVNWPSGASWMGDLYKLPFFIDSLSLNLSFSLVEKLPGTIIIWRQARTQQLERPTTIQGIADLDFRDSLIGRQERWVATAAETRTRILDVIGQSEEIAHSRLSLGGRSAPFRAVKYAGQQMSPPHVIFPELMLDSVRHYGTHHWNAYRGEKVVKFFRIRNAFIVGDGLVFDENQNVIEETIEQYDDENILAARSRLSEALRNSTLQRHPGASLLCGKVGMSNYGHWMVEMLPRAYVARDLIGAEDWKILLPHARPHISAVMLDSLALLGMDCEIISGDSNPIWCEELIIVTGLTKHGEYYLPATAACLQEIGRSVPAAGPADVWVSRSGEARSLKDEAELEARLSEQGWRVMRPAQLSLREQISIAKGAHHMAGVDGAGLTNLGFMASGSKITSFIPGNMPDLFFWALAQNIGVDYREVRCDIEPPTNPAIPWNGLLRIDPAVAMALLATPELQ